MKNKKVSVIVPVYNVEQYLEECLNSIIYQTYKNLEIILVDDGSTDSSGMICDRYKELDNRIRVVHKKNGGLSDARNTGMRIAEGECLVFIDSDDWIEPIMIEKLIQCINESHSDIAICGINVWDENNKTYQKRSENERKLTRIEVLEKLGENRNLLYVVAWNKIYKKHIFQNINYPVGYVHEDEAVIHRIYDKCESVYIIKDELYNYRLRNGSIMRSDGNIKKIDGLVALADRISFARKNKLHYLESETMRRYDDILWNIVCQIPDFYKERIYVKRLKKSIRHVILSMAKNQQIPRGHKYYMVLMGISMKLFRIVNKTIQKNKKEN